VNAPCQDFRRLLEGRLARRAAPERLADLAWHEHLFTCEACRAILDTEEALESLLASLPEPRLEPAVRDRVLARLRDVRDEERLDRLLDLADTARAPEGLAGRVLADVSARARDERLDRLLDLDVVTVPEGLAQRTRNALRLAQRAPALAQRTEVHAIRSRTWRVAGFVAAAAVLAVIAWVVRGIGAPRNDAPPVIVDVLPAAPERSEVVAGTTTVSDEMLAALDVLENWDVLVTEDVETLLSTLPADAAVLLEDLEDEG
jgi:hypothetical protein